ncbi:hypothetical protein TomTYG45_37780 [Sphingobium sp. TomTYG45]
MPLAACQGSQIILMLPPTRNHLRVPGRYGDILKKPGAVTPISKNIAGMGAHPKQSGGQRYSGLSLRAYGGDLARPLLTWLRALPPGARVQADAGFLVYISGAFVAGTPQRPSQTFGLYRPPDVARV